MEERRRRRHLEALELVVDLLLYAERGRGGGVDAEQLAEVLVFGFEARDLGFALEGPVVVRDEVIFV